MKSPVEKVIVGAIVVVFNPDLNKIMELLNSLKSLPYVVVVKNDGDEVNIDFWTLQISKIINVEILQMTSNVGVGRAINQGVDYLELSGVSHIWTFDQDSKPQEDALKCMLDSAREAHRTGQKKIAAVVPLIYDLASRKNLKYISKNMNGEMVLSEYHSAMKICSAITSGMLIPIDAWNEIGSMNEGFFIDHVDTEWCFRAISKGFELIVSPGAVLEHHLGDLEKIDAFLFSWNLRRRPPLRTYYILRNGCRLISMPVCPRGWSRYFYLASMRIILKALIFGPSRYGQLKAIVSALTDCRKSAKNICDKI